MANVRKIIETVTNIAILCVCLAFGWSLIHSRFISASSASGHELTRLEGETLKPLPGYSWQSRPDTLILAIRRGCHFCEDSLPFYRKLGELQKSDKLSANVLAVMPDDPESGSEFLRKNDVAVPGVFNLSLDALDVSGTPTLLLVNASGRVQKAWIGRLSPEAETSVIAAVENTAANTRLPGPGIVR